MSLTVPQKAIWFSSENFVNGQDPEFRDQVYKQIRQEHSTNTKDKGYTKTGIFYDFFTTFLNVKTSP